MDLFTTIRSSLTADRARVATSAGTVLVVLAELREWRPWLAGAETWLDSEERQRIERKRQPQDREALTMAYALHRLLLATILDREPAAVALGRDELGCPQLADDPIRTSLSHTPQFVAMAIGACRVGVDIEALARASELPGVQALVCHPDEARALADIDPAGHALALLELWVRKEALLKAAGIGLQREMDTFMAPPNRSLPLPDRPGETSRLWMLEAGRGCVVAVAAADAIQPMALWLGPGGAEPVRVLD